LRFLAVAIAAAAATPIGPLDARKQSKKLRW